MRRKSSKKKIDNICFYNTQHIGDVYHSSIFINMIASQNPNLLFYYYFINGDIFFSSKNLKRLGEKNKNYNSKLISGIPPENLQNNNLFKFLLQKNHNHQIRLLNYENKNILFINTWCMASWDGGTFPDYDFPASIPRWLNLIKKIQIDYKISINLELKVNQLDIIKYPDINLTEDEIEFLKTKIFIFNYKPRSINFSKEKVISLVNNYSNSNKILLAEEDPLFENNMNIEFFDKKFNIYPDIFCENLIILWQMIIHCKKIIILPTGGSWTFLHVLDKIRKNQIYLFHPNNDVYLNILNKNINYIVNENINLINKE